MQSFGVYIAKRLGAFALFIVLLLGCNALLFALVFYRTVAEDYGEAAPRAMLERTAACAAPDGLPEEAQLLLRQNGIWALYLAPDGQCGWSAGLPAEVPTRYTLAEVAAFSRGYIAGYPVFVWGMDEGLLVLGYPKDSYTKLTGNYFSLATVRAMPLYGAAVLLMDLALLFFAYSRSKRSILKSAGPIVCAVGELAKGRPVSLPACGELSEIADSLNAASRLLERQNEARANWISGVSHDIRTPLSTILGYAGQIADDEAAPSSIREKAAVMRRQSLRIKELVQDLNLVSQLEYEMQPLHTGPVRLARLVRSCAADFLNDGLPASCTLEVEIAPGAEQAVLEGDARLLERALHNLVQNSIRHNPQGCAVRLSLTDTGGALLLAAEDDGTGLPPEKLRELREKPHYMHSAGSRTDLRHGLGLLLVGQIAAAHGGTLHLENVAPHGCRAALVFPKERR